MFGSFILGLTGGLIVLAITPYKSIVWAKYYLENLDTEKTD